MWTLVGSWCEAGGEAVGVCKGMRKMNWRRRGSCLYVEDLARHWALGSGRSARGDDAKSYPSLYPSVVNQSLFQRKAVSRLELEPDIARASDAHTSSLPNRYSTPRANRNTKLQRLRLYFYCKG